MADRSEAHEFVPRHGAWERLHRVAGPALVFRLAGRRPPAEVGGGWLAVQRLGRGAVRLEYRGTGAEERDACLRRQVWALRVPAACGASHATLREDGCLAHGDPACRYVVTWTDRVHLASALLTGMLVVAVLAASRLPVAVPATWLLVPAAVLATYVHERRQTARATPIGAAQSAAAFRWLLGRSTSVVDPARTEPRAADVVIEREGDMWLVSYRGTTARLRHSRGLMLLSHLVANPGQEIHVSALDAITPSGGSVVPRNAPAGGVVPVPGDAGELLDAQARSEYRRRILALRHEIAEAEEHGDHGRLDAMRAELEMLEDQLQAAVGPAGRIRRAPGDAERLRVAITHRIRAAIAQIAQRHPDLGAHLAATVSTGYRCVYQPVERPAPEQRERNA